MLQRLFFKLIAAYQHHLRGYMPTACRFYPSCSEYTAQAMMKYGLIRGIVKSLARLLRCHPWSAHGGYDPLV